MSEVIQFSTENHRMLAVHKISEELRELSCRAFVKAIGQPAAAKAS